MGAPSPRKKRSRKSSINDPVWQAGYEEGWIDARKTVLDFLEVEFMNPLIAKDSPEAQAALELAKRLAEELKVNHLW